MNCHLACIEWLFTETSNDYLHRKPRLEAALHHQSSCVKHMIRIKNEKPFQIKELPDIKRKEVYKKKLNLTYSD